MNRALRAPLIAAVRDEDLSRAATRQRVDMLLAEREDTESVSQEAERDVLHKPRATGLPLEQGDEGEGEPSEEARFARDLYTLSRVLDRWELRAARDQSGARTALLHIVDELSTRLERIAHLLLPASEQDPGDRP